MNVTVNQNAPQSVSVTTAAPVQIEVEVPAVEVSATAKTVQPAAAGMFVERIGEDDWTIWIEDGN